METTKTSWKRRNRNTCSFPENERLFRRKLNMTNVDDHYNYLLSLTHTVKFTYVFFLTTILPDWTIPLKTQNGFSSLELKTALSNLSHFNQMSRTTKRPLDESKTTFSIVEELRRQSLFCSAIKQKHSFCLSSSPLLLLLLLIRFTWIRIRNM